MPEIDATLAARFAQLALDCVEREYPHSNLYWFDSDEDVLPPRELTPAFYGCLDWHSAVHGHWLLARIARYFPDTDFTKAARAALARSLTDEKIKGEIAFRQPRPFFECPYGLAWLLQLAAELHEWNDAQAKEWLAVLEPLEKLVADNLHQWLEILFLPNRTGTHAQTAFALGLALDWARLTADADFAILIENKALSFYLKHRSYPLHFEPLGYDFFSPCLAEADLMRRILPPTDFADWLSGFLPQLLIDEQVNWLQPVYANNPSDYLQSHFHGLNLSRAWMLEGIISKLPIGDRRLIALRKTAILHRQVGLAAITGEHYAGGHWLGSFAVYLVTARGLSKQT